MSEGAQSVSGEPKPPRDHHFVVRAYLEFFATGEPLMVEVADVEEGRAWRCTAKETGFERDLYRLPSAPPENEFALETGPLREVEGQAIPILRSMNENRALPVGSDYARIILYLFVQFMRTPAFLGHVAKITLGLMQDLMRRTASSDEEWERFLNESKGEPPPVSREEMKTIELEGRVRPSPEWIIHTAFGSAAMEEAPMAFHNKRWSLFFSDGARFVTSDNPVAHAGPWIMFPVGPRVALLGRDTGPRETRPIDDRAVALFNRTTLANARRYLYSSDASFEWLAPGVGATELAEYREDLRHRRTEVPSLQNFRP